MKKSIIAASASAVALAAMPALGAFADVTDTVTVTINSACNVGATTSTTGAGADLSATMTNGSTKVWDADGTAGGKLLVSCNDASGWNIKAVGASTGSSNTSMTPTNATSTPIATGTTTGGDASSWAFKLASSVTGVSIASPYNAFAAVPGTATKVASGSAAISEGQINTGYQVFISATQQADTYTGKVTYTVATGVGN